MDWYEIDLNEATEIDNYVDIVLENIGQMLLRFIRYGEILAWVIEDSVISETYKQDYEKEHAFGKNEEGQYFIGFKQEEL